MSTDRQGLFGQFEKAIEKYCPDPLLFAVFLTIVMLALVLLFTDTGGGEALSAWGNGLHGLLAFTMQMCLMVVTAHVLAHTGPVEKLLQAVGRIPNNPWQAYLIVILCAAAFSLACWPLGLIAGGLIAREVASTAHERNIPLNYPLLTAAAFGGFVVWEMGYSSSIGLTVATPGNPLEQTIGGIIPVTETLLSWWNLLTIVTTLAVVYLVVMLLARWKGSELTPPPLGPDKITAGQDARPGIMGRLENGRSISLLLALMLLSYLAYWFASRGFELSLNIVNWSFLALGLLLARSILHYSALFANGARVAAPLLLQYPLYGGIMGLALETGLAEQVTNLVIMSASPGSLPFAGFSQRRADQYLHTFRGRAVGRAGTCFHTGRPGPGCQIEPDHHVHCLGRPVDQSGATVLCDSDSGDYRSEITGNIRLLLRNLPGDSPSVYPGTLAGAVISKMKPPFAIGRKMPLSIMLSSHGEVTDFVFAKCLKILRS